MLEIICGLIGTYFSISIPSAIWLYKPLAVRGDVRAPKPEWASIPLAFISFPLIATACIFLHKFKTFSVLLTLSKGVPVMLRSLISLRASILAMACAWAVGAPSPKLYDRAVDWYNAPPEPPSAEAQKLINSLNLVEGWKIGNSTASATISNNGNPAYGKVPNLSKNNIQIILSDSSMPWSQKASITVDGSDCSNQFSSGDLKALNKAGNFCVRKLTARAMDITVTK